MKKACLILAVVLLFLLPVQAVLGEKDWTDDFRFAQSVGSFSGEGLAVFQARSGLYGFVDTSGKVVIPPRFEMAYDFSDGLASVRKGEYYGFINTEGDLVFSEGEGYPFSRSSSFSNGLAAVYNAEKSSYGYIDPDGNLAIDYQFSYEAGPFKNGYASTDKGIINTQGEIVIENTRGTVNEAGIVLSSKGTTNLPGTDIPTVTLEFTSGTYSNSISLKTAGGRTILRLNVDSSEDVKLTNAWKTDAGTILLIYGKSKFWNLPRYYLYNLDQDRLVVQDADSVGEYSDGLIPVSKGDYHCFLDADGDYAFFAGDNANAFSDGYALVRLADSYYYLDSSGNPVRGPYIRATSFSNGYAAVYEDGWTILSKE